MSKRVFGHYILLALRAVNTGPVSTNDKGINALADAPEVIVDTLTAVPGVRVELLKDNRASRAGVTDALKRGTYNLIHFNGHAHFNDARPYQSGLVLWDQDLTTGAIYKYFSENPPIPCFINACETAVTSGADGKYDIFGLGRAFLETGAYLLGTRWRVSDQGAMKFAEHFYGKLIVERQPLGCARSPAHVPSAGRLPRISPGRLTCFMVIPGCLSEL